MTEKSRADQKVGLHPHQTRQGNTIHGTTASSLVYTPGREKNGHFLALYWITVGTIARLRGKSKQFSRERAYFLLVTLENPNEPSSPI